MHIVLLLFAAAAATHTHKVKKQKGGGGGGCCCCCSCSRHFSPTLICVHSCSHLLTFAAVACNCWGGHRCRGSCCCFPVCAHSPSQPSSPSPHVRALVPIFVWPLFVLPCLCACPIHLCPLGCLPVQPLCGLRLHLFVLTHPAYSCLFLSRLAFDHARSFVCLSLFICASPHVHALVPVFIWALFVLICARSPCLFVFVPIFVWPSLGLICAPWLLVHAYIKYTIS